MNRFAACSDPRAETGPRIAKMTKDEMVEWFKSAPMGSRHHALIEAERGPPDEYLDVLGLTR